jgi:periplasmic divalent cation tolerance protein
MATALMCFCTCPNPEVAHSLARTLVDARLAACVNIIAGMSSIYRWEGAICEDTEALLLIKTSDDAYPLLEAAVKAQHPYELPELIAVPVVTGFAAYLTWLSDCVIS